jgi:predicted RND superfamily exporter protein
LFVTLLLGILSVGMATVFAFGICGYLGVTFSSAAIAVPFLILGIGLLKYCIN